MNLISNMNYFYNITYFDFISVNIFHRLSRMPNYISTT